MERSTIAISVVSPIISLRSCCCCNRLLTWGQCCRGSWLSITLLRKGLQRITANISSKPEIFQTWMLREKVNLYEHCSRKLRELFSYKNSWHVALQCHESFKLLVITTRKASISKFKILQLVWCWRKSGPGFKVRSR